MARINSNRTFLELKSETAWADGGTGSAVFVPFLDGDYSVGLDDPLREQNHIVGDQDAQYIVQDIRNLAGDLKIGMWPHIWKAMLDWASVRTTGELASYTVRWDVPGVEARVHRGMKVNQVTVEGSNGGDIMQTMGLIGKYEATEANLTYPGAYVVPDIASLTFKNCRFVVSLDAGDAFANRISPEGLETFRITLANNLKVGPSREDRIDLTKDGAIEFLTPGRRKVDLTYTALFNAIAYSTLQRSRLFTQLKVMGAHPAWSSYLTVDAGGAAAGSAVAVPLTSDPAGIVAVNDYVMFDGAGGELPSVGKVTALDSVAPFGITIDVLDEPVEAGDHVFNGAIEIKTGPALVQNSTPSKPFDDLLKVTINAQIFSGGADPFTYKCKDMTLP